MITSPFSTEEDDEVFTDEEYDILLEDLFAEESETDETPLEILEIIYDEEYTKTNLYY